jgi:hypothetical protein
VVVIAEEYLIPGQQGIMVCTREIPQYETIMQGIQHYIFVRKHKIRCDTVVLLRDERHQVSMFLDPASYVKYLCAVCATLIKKNSGLIVSSLLDHAEIVLLYTIKYGATGAGQYCRDKERKTAQTMRYIAHITIPFMFLQSI